jgi:hypothetical protein
MLRRRRMEKVGKLKSRMPSRKARTGRSPILPVQSIIAI